MTVWGAIVFSPKQPYERPVYTIKAKPYFPKGETINWVGAVVYQVGEDPEVTPLPAMLISSAFDPDTTHISVRVDGGTNGLSYRIRFRWTTTDGGRYEAEGEFDVIEVV